MGDGLVEIFYEYDQTIGHRRFYYLSFERTTITEKPDLFVEGNSSKDIRRGTYCRPSATTLNRSPSKATS